MKIGRKQLVLASMILALGAAVYLNWQFAGTGQLPLEEEEDPSSQLGAAQLVNNAYVETVNDTVESEASQSGSEDVLSQVRLDRQNARDQATELLDQVLEGVESDPQAKQTAVEEASALAQNILRETNVENLLAAKGYEDSVAAISGEKCTVVVAGELTSADVLIVQEAVVEQTGFTADKIKIVGTK
ncbi:MAG TPA: SpoIIIAH-like family protein [Candidatus Acutalibacter pullistercoris]|uniref:SpoIIIAH-like family protein n=1 Tax=Candidatus Acutalibacter pullistercoris TaxID=2838418 RepID=A0A9D1YB65_9FIRM|nr:SpoIIIAH-like family protein [Candidatus Acutalibacter pullistercoris]